jgi:hypothetical protein
VSTVEEGGVVEELSLDRVDTVECGCEVALTPWEMMTTQIGTFGVPCYHGHLLDSSNQMSSYFKVEAILS